MVLVYSYIKIIGKNQSEAAAAPKIDILAF
jgi:hypothetical protein